MSLDDPRALWDAHAQTDPLWAVLSAPDKRGRRWRLREFMQDGEREIALLIRKIAELRLDSPHAPVIDFGCGVGRLSQALGRRFDDVTGVDISPGMVALAERVNQYPDRVRYTTAGLETFPSASIGFIYSNIVLQHMPPAEARRTLDHFFRLLDPRGLLVFQLPSHKPAPEEVEVVPMTEDAYVGAIALAADVPSPVSPGEEIPLPILVRNVSSRPWSQPGAGPMAAGNHWLDAAGTRMIQQDDGRAPLLQMTKPGTECRLVLRMRAPVEPGRYICEIDLVHEGVTWFAHKGSPTLRFPVEVVPQGAAGDTRVPLVEHEVPAYPDALLPPASSHVQAPPESNPFPMNGLPQDEVRRIVDGHHARIVHVEEDRHAGADWVSFTYFAERSPA